MHNYQELITFLRKFGMRLYGEETSILQTAADAIEQLVKERDAAVDDLRISSDCDFCKWLIGGDCTDFEHDECHGEHWEWRGVKETEHETYNR